MSKNIRAISARNIKGTTLFEAITEVSDKTGSPQDGQLRSISKERLISPASLLGASSFYDFLHENNCGKRVYVCNGIACMLAGNQKQIQEKFLRRFSQDEIGEVACLGHCYHGGAYWQGEQTFDVKSSSERESTPQQIPYYNAATCSLFTDAIGDLAGFYNRILIDAQKVIAELTDSRLRGRGGAGFHFGEKVIACANTPAGQKYIVCNGDEGDPGAFSDRYLLEEQPQHVLAGMLATAHAVGADTAYLYIRAEYPQAQQRVREAIQAFEQTPAFTQSQVRFRVIHGAGSYICGEETALLNSIEGLRPEVRTRPPYPTEEGLFGQPTLLSNVETFAAVPWILQHGGKAFAAMGTAQSTGTKLVSLDHSFNHPGVHEVELGTPLQQVFNEYGGGFHSAVKAAQIGGPLGCVIPLHKVSDLSLDFDSFCQHGFQLGHASIIGIPQDFPMIDLLRYLFAYMANESCGKCVPCRLGTKKGYDMLMAASKENPVENETFRDLLDTLEAGSLCGLGGGLPLPLGNILYYFAEELADYFTQRTDT